MINDAVNIVLHVPFRETDSASHPPFEESTHVERRPG